MKETTMKSAINFSPLNDKTWGKLIKNWIKFSQQYFLKPCAINWPPTELSQKIDSWLHNYCIDQFGSIPGERKQTAQWKPRLNKALQTLLQQKKECKAARKALLKAGWYCSRKTSNKRMTIFITQTLQAPSWIEAQTADKENTTAERAFKQILISLQISSLRNCRSLGLHHSQLKQHLIFPRNLHR